MKCAIIRFAVTLNFVSSLKRCLSARSKTRLEEIDIQFSNRKSILGLLLVQFSGSVHLSYFTGKANFAVVILSAQRSTLLLVSRNMSRVDGSIRLCEIERLL